MGLALGFASMNFHSIPMDLFGASLMSSNPHQEVVDNYDVRRHGGGMGAWLGIWTGCWIGSLGIGFLVGAVIIDRLEPIWGFYISIMLVAAVLLLNTFTPETRRSTYRRSVAEVKTDSGTSRRVARGEVMMHRVKTGPKWWGQEVYHGVLLSLEMLRQPGFTVMAIYVGWIYAQVVLITVLLGSLASRLYRMRPPLVGAMVASLAFGALIGVPFQKANLFSRARYREMNTSRMTLDNRMVWTSHLLRRTIFSIGLPVAGGVYTAVSTGPSIHPAVPAIVAAVIGCLACLAISECNGLIMETFDTSDLQPGMTGRPHGTSSTPNKRTNYSSFPRITAGFAVCHTVAYLFAAGASVLGGLVQRNLGQREATGVVAGILLILTALLILGLIRFKEVQIIPTCKTFDMERWTQARRESLKRTACVPATEEATATRQDPFAHDEPWRPILIGNPVSKTRRANVLELGSMTRWTEIRRKNKIIDTVAGTNRAALGAGIDSLNDSAHNIAHDARRLVSRSASQNSHVAGQRRRRPGHFHQSGGASGSESDVEMDQLRKPDGCRGEHALPGGFIERECVMGQTVPEERLDPEGQELRDDTGTDLFVTDTSADEGAKRREDGSQIDVSRIQPMHEAPKREHEPHSNVSKSRPTYEGPGREKGKED